ncbi:MAG TPA: sarcosine oxidase subunit delta [Arenicellales bacterium]|nr:sarcosine oxidase subunit delta [Arenicellales bacterium]
MIRIPCPFCGVRDHSEFSYGKDASIRYPDLGAPMDEWTAAVFERENIDGVVLETWHHVNGCRMWLVVERDTTSHEIHSVRPAHPGWEAVLAGGADDTEGRR